MYGVYTAGATAVWHACTAGGAAGLRCELLEAAGCSVVLTLTFWPF